MFYVPRPLEEPAKKEQSYIALYRLNLLDSAEEQVTKFQTDNRKLTIFDLRVAFTINFYKQFYLPKNDCEGLKPASKIALKE